MSDLGEGAHRERHARPVRARPPGAAPQNDQIAQSPTKAYLKHARGRKAIVFATNVKAAHEYTAEFNAAGIPAATVWGNMDAGLRRQTLDDYKAGRLQVLTNVGVLTEVSTTEPRPASSWREASARSRSTSRSAAERYAPIPAPARSTQ